MRFRVFKSVALVALVWAMNSETRSYAENLRIVKQAFVGRNFFIGFTLSSEAWLSIQRSGDALTWTDIGSVASTNGSTVFVDEEARAVSNSYYRLRQPGFTVEEADAKWRSRPGINYRFQLERGRLPDQPSILRGTVVVTGDDKSILEAEADGDLLPEPDPREFPSIEEIFNMLKQAQQSGCWRVAVTYHPELGYPIWCGIERVTSGSAPKEIDIFRISGVTVGQ
jgi:hypothetical protein